MIKKVLVGGIFLVGGYYLIKKLLPTNTSSQYDLDLKEYEVEEFNSNKGVQKQPISINRNKSIDQVRDRQYYGQSMGSQQEIGSESPIGKGYVYGNNRKIYL